MEETPEGTPVGVDDPYEYAGVCDHLTSDGRCRFALAHAGADPAFAADRREDGYECVVADEDTEWSDCPHYRSTADERECVRCGLTAVPMPGSDERPLLEEHHLSYGGGDAETPGYGGGGRRPTHEITVTLCRWCHTKVHRSFARIDDDASPDPEAIAVREQRRGKELDEMAFRTAAERYDRDAE